MMLEKYFEIKDRFGSLTLYKDIQKGLFVVEPRGIINPHLIKIDLNEAYKFGELMKRDWVYLVNTQFVLFPNPMNLFYLRKINELPYMKKYIIYAPSIIVRLLGLITGFIIKPNKVIKTKAEFQNFIK